MKASNPESWPDLSDFRSWVSFKRDLEREKGRWVYGIRENWVTFIYLR